jgi:endoglucanase
VLAAPLTALVLSLAGSTPAAYATGTSYPLSGGPFAGRDLYVSPSTSAAAAAAAASDPTTKQLLSRIAAVPQAIWLAGGTPSSAASLVSGAVSAAGAQVTEFVVYDIPHRDCTGGQSAGGATSSTSYQNYVAAIASALTGAHAVVVLEPDALAGLDCLSATDQSSRLSLLKWATSKLAAKSNVLVYLDAGNYGWQSASTMAGRLTKAGIANARGFALNVSNFDPTSSEISYGSKISSLVGWKRFVVDVSRNGTTPRVSGWCNPPGAALGVAPGSPTGYAGADALLWIKHPGESDGVCGAGIQPAGQFDVNLAVSLATLAGW